MSEATLISIVDDDALVCDGIAALVESLGYEAVTFTSAEHFLRSDGHPNEKHRTRAFENGAVGYLSKPFDEQKLIECLTVAIKLQSSQARRRRTA